MEERLGAEIEKEEKKIKWPRTHRTLQTMSTIVYSISVITCTVRSSRFLLLSYPCIDKYIRLFSTTVLISPPYFRGAPSGQENLGLKRFQQTRKRVFSVNQYVSVAGRLYRDITGV